MSQTLTSLLVHLIFSTKNRVSIITPEVEPDLFAYMGGILKNCESRLLDAGGTSDHVHLLVSQSKNIAVKREQAIAVIEAGKLKMLETV